MLKRILVKPLVSGLIAVAALSVGLAAQAAEPTAFTVQVSGKGKPMILIAGLASSGAVWDATVAHFALNYRCYVSLGIAWVAFWH